MSQPNVDLSADLQRFVDSRVEDCGFVSRGAYLRALVERDQDAYRADVARVRALVDEGLASGVCERDAFAVIDELIAGIAREHG